MEKLTIGISQLVSFKNTMQPFLESFKSLGILLFILIVIVAVMLILAPTIIALIKKTKNRKVIVIANIIAGLFLMINFTLPFIIWAILFIAALTGKKELNTTVDIQQIKINTKSSQVKHKNLNIEGK